MRTMLQFWSVALFVAMAAATFFACRRELQASSTYWAGLSAITAGLVSGRVLAMLIWSTSFWESGVSAYGFLFGAAVGGGSYLRLRRLPLLPYADAAAPGIALGY